MNFFWKGESHSHSSFLLLAKMTDKMLLKITCLLILIQTVSAESVLKQVDGKKTVTGETVKYEDLEGKVILMDFWGMRCSPCVAGLPKLKELQKKFSGNKSFKVLTSHVTTGDKKDVLQFLKINKYDFTTFRYLHLTNKSGQRIPRGIPYLVLINKKGEIVEESPHISDLENKISKLLKE